MSVQCPHCGSVHIKTRNTTTSAGQTVGTVTGIAGAMQGASPGACVGLSAGPVQGTNRAQ